MFSLLWLQHTPLEKLDRKHFAKGSRRQEENGAVAPAPQEVENLKDVALMETKMIKICDLLSEVSTYCSFNWSLFLLVKATSVTPTFFLCQCNLPLLSVCMFTNIPTNMVMLLSFW